MKKNKYSKFLSILLICFMVLSIFPTNLFAKPDLSYMEKIEGTLRTVEPSETIEFIIKLKEKVDLNNIHAEEVVDFLKDSSEKSQENLLSLIDREVQKGNVFEFNSFYIVNSIFVKGKAELLAKIAKRHDVESIRANHKIIADPDEKIKKVSSLSEKEDSVPWNLASIQADRVNVTGADIVVGIIDSGVNADHPELQGAMIPNGFKDFVDPENQIPKDSTGHGTHVAGTILGRTIGVAKGARFIAARVFNENGEANDENLIKAGEWILEQKPRVVNNSWGGNRNNEFYKEIIEKWRSANILPIFSSGNVGLFQKGGEGSIGSPASLEGTFSVGALRKDDLLAKFSLRGPSKFSKKIKPDLTAPGVNILSADYRGGYVLKTGTSMAAPHVTGAVALLLEADPSLTITRLEEILTSTATPLNDNHYIHSPNFGYGYGKINVFKAVTVALGKSFDSFATFSGHTMIPGEDVEKPSIKATTPKKFYNAYDFDLDAEVADNVGIKSVHFYYKAKSENSYKVKPFTLYAGNRKNGQYSITLIPSDLTVKQVDYYLEAEDLSGNKMTTPVITADVESGIKIGYSNSFEDGADGFVFGGKTPMWEVGIPTVGPKDVPDGKNVVGTKLNGNYDGLLDSLLISPPIDLTGETRNAILKFHDWSELDNYMGGLEDSAEVWIGELNTENPRIENIVYESKPALLNRYSKRFWKEHIIDLSAYKNKKIIVMFALRWAGASKRNAAGYYIDNFKLEALSTDAPVPPSENLRIENFTGTGKVRIYFDKVPDPEVLKYRLYRSKSENDGYVKIIDDTPFFQDTPTPQEGTYYYKIASLKGNTESEKTRALSITYTVGELFKKYSFETEEGWSSDGEVNWEKGAVDDDYDTPGPNNKGAKNPDSPTVYAAGLNKSRKPNKVYELLSPVIDLSSLTKANLYYQTWYDFNRSDQDQGEIWFKMDNEWKKVYVLNDEFEKKNINGHTRAKGSWSIDGLEIPKEYLNDHFQMKFVLRSSGDYGEAGWYIDDVAIYDTSKVSSSSSNQTEAEKSFESMLETATSFHSETANENTKNTSNEENVTPPSLSETSFMLSGMKFYTSENSGKTTTIPISAFVKILETNTYIKSEVGSGAFEIKHPSGTFHAIAYNEAYRSQPFEIILKDGEKLEQDLLMTSLSTYGLSLDIKNTNGEGVTSDIKIFEKGSSIPKYVSSGKSTVILTDVPEGEYQIVVLSNGYKTHEKMISVYGDTSVSIILSKLHTSGKKREVAHDKGNITDATIVSTMRDKGTLSVKYHFDSETIIKSIRFGLKKATKESIAGKPFQYSIYGENTKDGYPGKLLFGPASTTVSQDNDFTEVEVPDLLVKGSVYIAYTQVGENDRVPRIAVDETTKKTGITFKMINGAWNEASEIGMYMIRLGVEDLTNEPSPSLPPTTESNTSSTLVNETQKESKKEVEQDRKILSKVQEMEKQLEKQIDLIEKKMAILDTLEKKIKTLEKIEKRLKTIGKKKSSSKIETMIKKEKAFKVDLKTFYQTKNIDQIKIKIKGLKQGKDFDVFFKKEKNKIKILIIGKGKWNGMIVKTIPLSNKK